jgi:hypothetical protein
VILSSAGQVIKEELISAIDSSKAVKSAEDEDGGSLVLVPWPNLQDVGLGKWWPFGYGEQKLYSARVEIFDPVNFFKCLSRLISRLTVYLSRHLLK